MFSQGIHFLQRDHLSPHARFYVRPFTSDPDRPICAHTMLSKPDVGNYGQIIAFKSEDSL